ncbi:MAG: hypothetical protein M3391_05100 [Actinomycetota bacterium]|nr:hypothetical protein [Actinomycetota bacterium]
MVLAASKDTQKPPLDWYSAPSQATFYSMALTAFCSTCQRTVYIEEADTPVCPVCSTPLLETVEDERSDPQDEKVT